MILGRLRDALLCRVNGRPQRGSVAVEFALAAPILVMLLIGTLTTGLSYAHAIGLTNAVREGARFGAVADSASASYASDVINRVRATQFDDPNSETSVCVEFWQTDATAVASKVTAKSGCAAAGGPGVSAGDLGRYPLPAVPPNVCIVRVVAARNFTINAVMLPVITNKMTRGSVARYEGSTC